MAVGGSLGKATDSLALAARKSSNSKQQQVVDMSRGKLPGTRPESMSKVRGLQTDILPSSLDRRVERNDIAGEPALHYIFTASADS